MKLSLDPPGRKGHIPFLGLQEAIFTRFLSLRVGLWWGLVLGA